MKIDKLCKKCNTVQPITDFPPMAKSKDGHGPWCRKCKRIDSRNKYKQNKEYYIKKAAEWKAKQK